MKRFIKGFFFIILVFPLSSHALDISPAADGFVRSDGGTFTNIIQVLDVPSLKYRGVIEFSLNSIDCPSFNQATLQLDVYASMGPYPFNINVYSYTGNGSVDSGDYSVGTLSNNFLFNGTETSVDIDVTSAITNFLNSNSDYAGFNLRFEPGSNINLNGPYVAFSSQQFPPAGKLILSCSLPPPEISECPPNDINCIGAAIKGKQTPFCDSITESQIPGNFVITTPFGTTVDTAEGGAFNDIDPLIQDVCWGTNDSIR